RYTLPTRLPGRVRTRCRGRTGGCSAWLLAHRFRSRRRTGRSPRRSLQRLMSLTRDVSLARMLRASVPATSANLGPGFDTLGLAIDLYLEVTAESARHDEFVYLDTHDGAGPSGTAPQAAG